MQTFQLSCVVLFSLLSDGGSAGSARGEVGTHLPVDGGERTPPAPASADRSQAARSADLAAELATDQGDHSEADGGRARHRDGCHTRQDQNSAGDTNSFIELKSLLFDLTL